MKIALNVIRMDGGTQSRAQLDWVAIDEYAADMRNEAEFPPIVVYYDGAEYWLADGFHRVRAAQKAMLSEIESDVRQGTRRDAILHSVGANADNGVRRTSRDKRQAVTMLLHDEEWREWSSVDIAKWCVTTDWHVRSIRRELIEQGQAMPDRVKYMHNGKVTTRPTFKSRSSEPLDEETRISFPSEPESLIPPNILVDPIAPARPITVPLLNNGDDGPRFPIAIHNKDARFLVEYSDDVHLVVTSPPYNVGIEYDTHADELSSYYNLLADIWTECYAVMVPGARICVNVPFGVGRNPWIPMALDVMKTLTDTGFILRGQIIWDKNTTGNRTSWGSFRLPTDPGLRDTTECVIVAHKGQSNLEIPDEYRLRDDKGSHTAWLKDSDYFMELAQDHWQIAPESAQRIKHPAPFPPELVRRLIHFYGFPGCHVLDPFAGSGTVGVAAKELGCQATLFEISEEYCRIAGERINEKLPV